MQFQVLDAVLIYLSLGFLCILHACTQGLEAQLLGIVVRKERPELEEQKDSLVISIASGKKSLQDLEDEILRFQTLTFVLLHQYFPHIMDNVQFRSSLLLPPAVPVIVIITCLSK